MAHPAQHHVEAARRKRSHPAGVVEGKRAAVKRLDRKGGGAVDVSSWRPPVACDPQPLNQEVIETSMDRRKGIADARGDIPERKKYADGGKVEDVNASIREGGQKLSDIAPGTDLNRKLLEMKYGSGQSSSPGYPPQPRKSGGRLTAHERQSLPKSDFALPGKGSGPKGAGSGSYPIPDESHARNALARASGKPVEAAVRAKVHAKYPDIGEG